MNRLGIFLFLSVLLPTLTAGQCDYTNFKERLDRAERQSIYDPSYWDSLAFDVDRCIETIDQPVEDLQILKARILNHRGYAYKRRGFPGEAMKFYQASLTINERFDNKKGIANNLLKIGVLHDDKGEDSVSMVYFNRALDLYEDIGDKKGQADVLYRFVESHYEKGHTPQALKILEKRLDLFRDINDTSGILGVYGDLGTVHNSTGNDTLAIYYFTQAMELARETNDPADLADSYQRLASWHAQNGSTDTALYYYSEALKHHREVGFAARTAQCLRGLGLVQNRIGQVEDAVKCFREANDLFATAGDVRGVTATAISLAELHLNRSEHKEARIYAEKAMRSAQELGHPDLIMKSALWLKEISGHEGKWKDAYEYQSIYFSLHDSLSNVKNLRATAQQHAKFEYEKKAAADSVRNAQAQAITQAELDAERAENARQREREYYLYGAIGLAILFIGFVYNRFRVTNRQKDLIASAHGQLELKNKEIVDSITYAQRIQSAILPEMSELESNVEECFILYKPKDIVAGDFYFMEEVDDHVYIAAADCTGHGVPGAMVSVVCSNALTKALVEEGITDTGKLLDRTREHVIHRFGKTGERINDGMDISLIAIRKDKQQVRWSGANNPLWIMTDKGNFREFKPDKQPIGNYIHPTPFKQHVIDVEPGYKLYMFTDGFIDQFGGPKGKKLKSKKFKSTIESMHTASMAEQHTRLNTTFEEWRGDIEQIDDVCVIGVKV